MNASDEILTDGTEGAVLTDEQVCAILLASDPFQSAPPRPREMPNITVNIERLARLRRALLPSGDEVAAAFDTITRPQCPSAASAERAREWLEWARSEDVRESGVWLKGTAPTSAHESAPDASISLQRVRTRTY